MSASTQNIGDVVVAFTAPDTDGTHFTGVLMGIYDCPTGLVECGDGRETWALHLMRPATAEEAIAYWKDRARKAEAAASSLGGDRGRE